MQAGQPQQPVVEQRRVLRQRRRAVIRAAQGLGQALRAEPYGLHIVHVQVAEGGEGVGQRQGDGLVLAGGGNVVRPGRPDGAVHQLPRQLLHVPSGQGAFLAAERDQGGDPHRCVDQARARPLGPEQLLDQRCDGGRSEP